MDVTCHDPVDFDCDDTIVDVAAVVVLVLDVRGEEVPVPGKLWLVG